MVDKEDSANTDTDDDKSWWSSLASNIIDSIGSLGDSIISGVTKGIELLLNPIKAVIDLILSGINAILEFLGGLVSALAEAIGNLLKALFIPSDGYFDDKFDQIRERFDVVDSMCATIDVFTNFFENNSFLEPPVITVNLSSGKGLNYGQNAKAIDFSWYAPYKATVDVILSSILWTVFVWNTFKDLPNIIHGVGSGATATAELQEEARERYADKRGIGMRGWKG